MSMLKDLIILLVGFALLIKSSEYMIDSASNIAKVFKIPPFIIGFSVIAFGTSAPELIIGIITGISKTNQITMGNVLGSTIANIALVVGIAAIFKTIPIEKSIIRREIPLFILSKALLMLLLFIGDVLSRVDGVILLICFALFLFYIFNRLKASIDVDEEDTSKEISDSPRKQSNLILAAILLFSMAGVFLGGNFVVQSSTEIARAFGISELVIGLTVVAVGTSLPELITTIISMLKNKSDIAIGNIIGSNIFNILLVLGTSSVIHPIPLSKGIQWDFILGFGAAALMVLLSVRKNQLKRPVGIILLLYYLGYILLKILTN